jgi:RNA polymerase sigma-70 factor, ECF subfamily
MSLRQELQATVDRMNFNELYERHSREVWAVAYARRMDAHAAMDVVQEAFLRLWKQSQGGEVIHNPRAWLLRVARNLAEDDAKSAFRRNGTHPPQTLMSLRSREGKPLDAVVEDEQTSQIRGLLREVSDADREILTLRYAAECSSEEIAETLGIKVAAVHMRLSRARQRLAERLAAKGVGPGLETTV